jgi:uncharacterized protein (TIGR02145 family)
VLCEYQNTSCDDGNINTINDLRNFDCVCVGDFIGNSIYNQGAGVTDIDGNYYSSIIVNNQEWMAQNLAVTRFRNGEVIPSDLNNLEWESTTNSAYSFYEDEIANGILYGKYYNWFAISDSRGLCPTGWHVPTDEEWDSFESHIGGIPFFNPNSDLTIVGTYHTGERLKSELGWDYSYINSDSYENSFLVNESGFSALPCGYRSYFGSFLDQGNNGYWWSGSSNNSATAIYRGLYYFTSNLYRNHMDKNFGFSVRCIKD